MYSFPGIENHIERSDFDWISYIQLVDQSKNLRKNQTIGHWCLPWINYVFMNSIGGTRNLLSKMHWSMNWKTNWTFRWAKFVFINFLLSSSMSKSNKIEWIFPATAHRIDRRENEIQGKLSKYPTDFPKSLRSTASADHRKQIANNIFTAIIYCLFFPLTFFFFIFELKHTQCLDVFKHEWLNKTSNITQ